jgi:hypothetical protein
MARLSGPLMPSRMEQAKKHLDVYYHRMYGWIARAWPRQSEPTQSIAWQAAKQTLVTSWRDWRSLPAHIYDAWKSTVTGRAKTALDYFRKVSMRSARDHVRSTYTTLEAGYITVGDETHIDYMYADDSPGIDASTPIPITAVIAPPGVRLIKKWTKGIIPKCKTADTRPPDLPIINPDATQVKTTLDPMLWPLEIQAPVTYSSDELQIMLLAKDRYDDPKILAPTQIIQRTQSPAPCYCPCDPWPGPSPDGFPCHGLNYSYNVSATIQHWDRYEDYEAGHPPNATRPVALDVTAREYSCAWSGLSHDEQVYTDLYLQTFPTCAWSISMRIYVPGLGPYARASKGVGPSPAGSAWESQPIEGFQSATRLVDVSVS